MKTAIKTSALFLGLALLSTGVFAIDKNTGKPKEAPATTNQNIVLFTSLSQDRGVQVIVHKATPANSTVRIYDASGNLLVTDNLSKKDAVSQKGYDLSQLEEGDYTIQVTANNTVTKRVVHVYNEDVNKKSFFFKM